MTKSRHLRRIAVSLASIAIHSPRVGVPGGEKPRKDLFHRVLARGPRRRTRPASPSTTSLACTWRSTKCANSDSAVKRRCPAVGLLHHSDQGSTYASEDYQAVLEAHGITCSMSRRGNCYDNAVMEAFFSTVKNEVGEWFESYGDAKADLFDYIDVFYNQRRRHSSAGRMSPAAFERKMTQAA